MFIVYSGSFRNPPNYDVDYRILNVRTWSFLCVCIHTEGWAHRQRVSTTFWLGKTLTILSCAPDGVRTAAFWISSPMLYQLSHPRQPTTRPSLHWSKPVTRTTKQPTQTRFQLIWRYKKNPHTQDVKISMLFICMDKTRQCPNFRHNMRFWQSHKRTVIYSF